MSATIRPRLAEDSTATFKTWQAEFTATDYASAMFIALSVEGDSGAAWFDNIRIETRIPQAGPAPEPVPSPIAFRTFQLGFVQENPINQSEKAMEEMIEKIGTAADVLNMFFHVCWRELTGEAVTWAHRDPLRQVQLARETGLKIALTFDFTHEHPDNVGHVNPLPDGTPKPVWALWEAIYHTNFTDIKANPPISNQPLAQFELFQNYPNPFNATTTIHYHLPEDSHVTLKIHNLSGQIVRTLTDQNQKNGTHSAIWYGLDENGLPVASGIYFYRLETGSELLFHQRLILLK